ncbi:MAG: hypothetical protein AAB924_00835 [Patescibacteria group bacterium]
MESENLEKLKKKLYQKDQEFPERAERESFRQKNISAETHWKKDEIGTKKEDAEILMAHKRSIFKSFKAVFYFVVAFLVLAIALIGYIFYSGSNTVSSSNISIDANGPIYVDGGQPARFNFTVRNQNSVALEDADLIFDFPANTSSSDGLALARSRFHLDRIESGAVINKSLDVVFFGTENEEKKISANLEYRLVGSNAIFVKSKDYFTKISKAPIGLSLSAPKDSVSGQKIIIKIAVISNAESMAKNLKLEMKYPTGFKFSNAEPIPIKGNNVWTIGDLGPSQKSNITIEGTLEGENSEERVFSASVGSYGDGGEMKPFGTASEKIVIKKSPLNLTLLINGEENPSGVFYAGEMIRVDLRWTNNLSSSIKNAQIELEINGEAYDQRSVSVARGAYRSYDNKAVWSPSSLSELASIASGSSGRAQLGFSVKNPLPIYKQGDKNFSISVEAKIAGVGTSDSFENKKIDDSVKKEIKIGSNLQAVGKVLYYSGAFKNTGVVPPKVGGETFYTVVWSLANNANDLMDTKIIASLPPYVSKENLVVPEDSDLQFDEKNATIIWNTGDVTAGTGIIMPAKEVSFQISFTPNLTQVGESPILINTANVSATDSFTGERISAEISALTTRLIDDPQSKGNDDKVRE